MTSDLDNTTADGNIQQNGSNPINEIEPEVDNPLVDRIRLSPVTEVFQQSQENQYFDSKFVPTNDTVGKNSYVEDQNEIKNWNFWHGNMGIEALVRSPPLSPMRRLASFQNPPHLHLRTPYQTPPDSLVNRPSPSFPQRRKRGASWSIPHLSMSRPSESQLITPGLKSASCSWFRGGLLCSDINNENSSSSSPRKEKHAADSPRFFKDLQKARRASLKETKQNKMPFQSLFARLANTLPGKSIDATNTKTTSPDKRAKMTTRKWNMVVDITTLLSNESRRSLQFLEGLEGTQLIIPIIVIKNLAYLNHQVSFLGETTEVSSALEWIKECIAYIPWWIHVHDPEEEGLLVTPTRGEAGSSTFSSLEPPQELLLSTVGDHVLGCAISFRRNNNSDGQLVLLSSDSTLKIKAIAVVRFSVFIRGWPVRLQRNSLEIFDDLRGSFRFMLDCSLRKSSSAAHTTFLKNLRVSRSDNPAYILHNF